MKKVRAWGGHIALLVVLALGPFYIEAFYLDVLTTGVIYGGMAMGLALLVGRAGLPSLGHAAFVGAGGYAAAVIGEDVGLGPVAGLLAAAVVGGLLAVLLGLMSLRSKGVYFLMVSLALAELVHASVLRSDMLGGDNGKSMDSVTIPLLSGLGLPYTVSMYWYSLAVTALVFVVLRGILAAPAGLNIVGSRDNPERMRALGYSVPRLRMLALVVSGCVVALGGALLTQKDVFVSPAMLGPQMSILLLVMVLVGGTTSLVGPFLAGVGLVLLRSVTSSNFGDYWVLILGSVFVLTVYFLPQGVAGLTALMGRSRVGKYSHQGDVDVA